MLTQIHITPGAIADMLDVSSAYISKVRRMMAKDIFKIDGGTKGFDEKIDFIC